MALQIENLNLINSLLITTMGCMVPKMCEDDSAALPKPGNRPKPKGEIFQIPKPNALDQANNSAKGLFIGALIGNAY